MHKFACSCVMFSFVVSRTINVYCHMFSKRGYFERPEVWKENGGVEWGVTARGTEEKWTPVNIGKDYRGRKQGNYFICRDSEGRFLQK